jgi:hypothetical protein
LSIWNEDAKRFICAACTQEFITFEDAKKHGRVGTAEAPKPDPLVPCAMCHGVDGRCPYCQGEGCCPHDPRLAAAPSDEQIDIRIDRAWIDGAREGWNLAIADDSKGLQEAIESRHKHILRAKVGEE